MKTKFPLFFLLLLSVTATWSADKKSPFFVEILANNKEFIGADKDGTIVKMSLPEMTVLMKYQAETDVKAKLKEVAVARNVNKLFALYDNNKLWILDVASGTTMKTMDGVDYLIPFFNHGLIGVHFRRQEWFDYYKSDGDLSQSFFKTKRTNVVAVSCDGKYLVAFEYLSGTETNIQTFEVNSGSQVFEKKSDWLSMPRGDINFIGNTYDIKVHVSTLNEGIFLKDDLGIKTQPEKCISPRELKNETFTVSYLDKEVPQNQLWVIRSTKEKPVRATSCSVSKDEKWIILTQKEGNLDLYSGEIETIDFKVLGIKTSERRPKYLKSVTMP